PLDRHGGRDAHSSVFKFVTTGLALDVEPLQRVSVATFTTIRLPSSPLWCRAVMAADASFRSAMVTNPKLQIAPVARSVITLASTIWPKDTKCARNVALVVSLLRLPTKS